MANLTVTIKESITLPNQNLETATNKKTISGVNQTLRRVDTIATTFVGTGIEILKFVDSESEQTAGSFVKGDVKYIRITNLDSTNFVDLYLIATNIEETRFKLDAGKTFMLSNAEFDASADDDIVVVGYVDMAYFSNLVDFQIEKLSLFGCVSNFIVIGKIK